MSAQTLILYVRPHCHLCYQARMLLSQIQIPFTMINIDEQKALQTQYNHLVPVLYAPWCDEELIFPFDDKRCQEWLAALPASLHDEHF